MLVFVGAIAMQAPHHHESSQAPQPTPLNMVPPAPPPVVVPDIVSAWVEGVRNVEFFTADSCLKANRVKQFDDLRRQTGQRVEKYMPGYTVNWATYEVVAKPLPVK